jgi:SAM-dependent methyltransferase
LPYVSTISKLAHEENFYGLTFIDLGCGDFQVGQQLLPLCSSYIGIDIVKVLIENNNNKFKDTKASFLCLNIIEDDLPTGDVCFVRQVLQHLSNSGSCGFTMLDKKAFYAMEQISVEPGLKM